jgi:sulfate permease, SulP family
VRLDLDELVDLRITALRPSTITGGMLSFIAMLSLRRLASRVPAALVVAITATVLVGSSTVQPPVLGDLPSGLSHLAWPELDVAVPRDLAPGALAIVLVGYAEALGGAKAAAVQSGGDIDPNQELIAHVPANILSGPFGGFRPICRPSPSWCKPVPGRAPGDASALCSATRCTSQRGQECPQPDGSGRQLRFRRQCLHC